MNVNTVQEGSQVLILNDCGLLDSGATLRDFLEVDALKSEVVLLFFLSGDEDSFGGVNALVDLESQEVLDFQSLSSLDDVDDDGEMGIGEHHSEFVSGGDSDDHVADDSSDCA